MFAQREKHDAVLVLLREEEWPGAAAGLVGWSGEEIEGHRVYCAGNRYPIGPGLARGQRRPTWPVARPEAAGPTRADSCRSTATIHAVQLVRCLVLKLCQKIRLYGNL